MRNRAVKRAGLVLLALLVSLTVTACRDKQASDRDTGRNDTDILLRNPDVPGIHPDRIELRLLSFHTGREFEFWQWLAKRYAEEHPNVDIKVDFISSDTYFSDNRLMASFASGHGPDIFFVSPGTIRRFEAAGILQPFTPYFTQEIRDDFYDSALESVTIDGDIYAVPIETELLGLYYNRDMFENRGLQPPKTWQEMKDAASALKSDKVSGLTLETFKSVYQSFNWLPFLWQTGSDLVTEDGRSAGLNGPEAAKMFAFFRGMIDEGLLNLHPSRPTTDIGILASGETAMQVSGTWNIRMLETIYADRSIGVVPLPAPEGGQHMTIAGGWKIGVNHYGKNTEEAIKFVMWAFAQKQDIPLKWVSEVKFAYPPRKSVMEAGGELYLKGLRNVFTQQIFGTERQEPQYPAEIGSVFNNSLQRLLYNRAQPEELVAEIRTGIDRFLSEIEK
ncbi:ABC transporter substrate-binding protein [Paenibacillus sp. MSJ-34]|uniref:ABC transporter substrate-binding protein n=1 Tax=Paenibacillus sp. MSJ-34 TaxID=2841529 RepID=UPI001C10D644|nr:ABC transporter substrate-binding protein [Paenibacillus sp. MSJ-34]MBU5445266.1 ABC transporter substrate-binding protein [Paenibacillus sp. MSJ-34]